MKETIWYITKYYSPRTNRSTGGRNHLLLKEIAQKEYNVIAIVSDSNNLVDTPTLNSKVLHQSLDSVDIVWLKTLKYKVAKSFPRILSWLHFEWNVFFFDKSKISKPDYVVVSSLSLLTILNGFYLKWRYKCVLAFEIRDIWPLTIVEEGNYSKSNPIVKVFGIIEKWGYKYSDIIIGTMPNLSEHVRNILKYDKKVYCSPMGISEEQIEQKKEGLDANFLDRYFFKNTFKVVHAGTIGITNALDPLFESALLLNNRMDIEILIVGDGALKKHYQEKYKELNNLVFVPKVDRKLVQSVLAQCDLLYFSVHKSKVWEYGQSLNKVVDYMASGKPILASYSGYPSMINEAKSGKFIEAGNVKLLTEEIMNFADMSIEERLHMGQKGRTWLIENRQYKKLAEEYISFLKVSDI